MSKYTRKDIIFFADDPRLENAIGMKVYASDNPTNLLRLANHGNPDLWCKTLAIIKKDVDYFPFATFVEDFGYKHYDAIILKKDE